MNPFANVCIHRNVIHIILFKYLCGCVMMDLYGGKKKKHSKIISFKNRAT